MKVGLTKVSAGIKPLPPPHFSKSVGSCRADLCFQAPGHSLQVARSPYPEAKESEACSHSLPIARRQSTHQGYIQGSIETSGVPFQWWQWQRRNKWERDAKQARKYSRLNWTTTTHVKSIGCSYFKNMQSCLQPSVPLSS